MNNFWRADAFFFISTIMFSAISIAFIIAVVYAIKILKDIRALIALVRGEAEKIVGDLDRTRQKMRGGAANLGRFLLTLTDFFGIGDRAPKKRKK